MRLSDGRGIIYETAHKVQGYLDDMVPVFCQLTEERAVEVEFHAVGKIREASGKLMCHGVEHYSVEMVAHVVSPGKFRLVGFVFQFTGLLLNLFLVLAKGVKQLVGLRKFLLLVCQFVFHQSLLLFKALNLTGDVGTDVVAVGLQGSQRFEFCFQAVDFSLQILYHRGEGFLLLLGDGEFHIQIFEGFPGVRHLGFERHALVGKPSSILFRRTVTCSCLCYRHPSRESPFLIDLGQFIVQGKKIVLVIYAVLTMEDFLEGELLILVYRQKRTVDVRIFSSQ